MQKYEAGREEKYGEQLMKSKKVMVFADVQNRSTDAVKYAYSDWRGHAEQILVEELKAVVNNVQETVQEWGWDRAFAKVIEMGKKQFHSTWTHYEWNPERQARLDYTNSTRGRSKNSKLISAAHMSDGFYAICKPQWTEDTPVMTQDDVLNQYVLMRIFADRMSCGVSISDKDGFAMLNKKIGQMK